MKSVEETRHDGRARGAIALGAMALIALLVPGVGIPFAIAGLILGVISLNSLDRRRAKAGIVMSLIGLSLASVILVTLAWTITSDTIAIDAVGTMILGRSLVVLVGGLGIMTFVGPLSKRHQKFNRENVRWNVCLALFVAWLSGAEAMSADWDWVLAYVAFTVFLVVSSVVGYWARRNAEVTDSAGECA